MRFPSWLKVYGDTYYRGICPTESMEQITFFNVLRRRYPRLAKIAIHPRNEGNRSHAQTVRYKAEGLNAGAADIIIPGGPTFVCELKRLDHTKSKWEKAQEDYLVAAQKNGCFVCMALGYKAALEAVEAWEDDIHNRSR